MNKFISSFFTFKGDNVDMNLFEMFMYGMIPGFGQLLMRINKFGGSLDKPYLLFPLLLFPPFSFIPVLIAKFGFLNKIEGGNVLDIYVIIPVIFRFIIIAIMAQLGSEGGILLQSILIFGSILITNIIRVLNLENCKSVDGLFGNNFMKNVSNSMIEYAIALLILFSTSFIPYIGSLLEGLRQIPIANLNNVSSIIDSSIWSIGLVTGYIMMNMIDVNYNTTDEICKGNIGLLRILISIIAFAVAIGYQLHEQLGSIITGFI